MTATIGKPILTVLIDDPDLSLFECFGKDDGHLVVLMFAWAYALSARWKEIIPRASPMEYTTRQAPWIAYLVFSTATDNGKSMVVELGKLTGEATRWWAAVLAPGEGWRTAIPYERWRPFSPWSVIKEFNDVEIFLTGSLSHTNSYVKTPASFEMALKYIEDYSRLHSANTQNRAALAAALPLPLAKLDNRKILLHAPRDFPPMYPYPPLVDTDIRDTNLGVQLHAHCPCNHNLQFLSVTWSCVKGRKDMQTTGPISIASKDHIVNSPQDKDVALQIDYSWLDRERDLSEGVTRNLFSWMRDMDGFTIAKHGIYRYEWIDAFDSDDESVYPEGEGGSITGPIDAQMGCWMARTMTRRCNSI